MPTRTAPLPGSRQASGRWAAPAIRPPETTKHSSQLNQRIRSKIYFEPYFVFSITSAATATHTAPTIRGLAREPHVVTECESHRVTVGTHRVVGERVAVPGLHVDAAG